MPNPKCAVPGCTEEATFEVILYDFYPYPGKAADAFFEQDFTCPFICGPHAVENEDSAQGERKPRHVVTYSYTNKHAAQGFTIYRPLTS